MQWKAGRPRGIEKIGSIFGIEVEIVQWGCRAAGIFSDVGRCPGENSCPVGAGPWIGFAGARIAAIPVCAAARPGAATGSDTQGSQRRDPSERPLLRLVYKSGARARSVLLSKRLLRCDLVCNFSGWAALEGAR